MTLFVTGFTSNLLEASDQDSIALKTIQTMQGCISFHKQAQQPLDSQGISEQRSAWDTVVAKAEGYINSLRAQNPYVEERVSAKLESSDKSADDLMMQKNETKLLFARLLDQYIAYLGQVYEKKGFIRNSYFIASQKDQHLAITPNEYALFLQTLQNAAQQTDWGKTINLDLPVITESRLIEEKNFTLNEIITALKRVPLPAGYSATAILAGAAGVAAVGAGAYYAYNNMDQLKNSMNDIESYFNKPSVPAVIAPSAGQAEEQKAVVAAEPTFLQNAQNGFRRGVYGAETGIVPGASAGGDAENYGLSGYSGQEALGTVAIGTALGAGASRIATSQATASEAAATKAAQNATAGTFGPQSMYAQLEATQASHAARDLAAKQAADKTARFNDAMSKINSRPVVAPVGPVTTATNNPGILIGRGDRKSVV